MIRTFNLNLQLLKQSHFKKNNKCTHPKPAQWSMVVELPFRKRDLIPVSSV